MCRTLLSDFSNIAGMNANNFQQIAFQRQSCRTYNGLHIDKASIKLIQEKIAHLPRLFDDVATPDIRLVDNDEVEGRLGTYGFIMGARQFLVMASGKSVVEKIQAGFMFEALILEITAMGLSTCWLGGTFRRGLFADVCGQFDGDKEVIIVSPVGHPTDKRRFAERMMRRFVKADVRKSFDTLFRVSEVDVDNSNNKLVRKNISLSSDSSLRRVLETVRIAPSSSNSQPWRASIEMHTNNDGVGSTEVTFNCTTNNRFSAIDMGIAYCHFLYASRQENLNWEIERNTDSVEMRFRSC